MCSQPLITISKDYFPYDELQPYIKAINNLLGIKPFVSYSNKIETAFYAPNCVNLNTKELIDNGLISLITTIFIYAHEAVHCYDYRRKCHLTMTLEELEQSADRIASNLCSTLLIKTSDLPEFIQKRLAKV